MKIEPVHFAATTPSDPWKPLTDMLTAQPGETFRVWDLPEGRIFRDAHLRALLEGKMPGYKIVVEYGDDARTPQSYLITAQAVENP